MKYLAITLCIVALASVFWAASVTQQVSFSAGRVRITKVGPDYLYPNPQLTTGKADTLNVADLLRSYTDHCPNGKASCTYSQDHRNVPAHEHLAVYNEYNVPPSKRNIKDGEVDHYYPLCAGGSNDLANLWYMPAVNMWNGVNYGYHEKDDLETYLCSQIKKKVMAPSTAYSCITGDWVACYMKLKPAHQTFSE